MQTVAISLFALSGLAAASPVAIGRGVGCSPTSYEGFSWSITSFDYHSSEIFTTPAHQNSWGYVNFNISNAAAPYTASCSAASDQLSEFFYGTQIYTCTLPDDAPAGAGETTFTFNRPTNELAVNQTWTCNEDPQYPVTFKGIGAANLTLDCQTTTYQNDNWTLGQIYSDKETKCAPIDFALKPSQMTAVA